MFTKKHTLAIKQQTFKSAPKKAQSIACGMGAGTVTCHCCVRSGTRTKEHVAIGSFVDVKQSTLGQHCQAKHLSYSGNATLRDNVNIGAGTVTCHYDGHCKHDTLIESDTFVGANASLIAPVTIGKKVTVPVVGLMGVYNG